MEAGALCLVDPLADVAESAAKGSNSVYNKQKISYELNENLMVITYTKQG